MDNYLDALDSLLAGVVGSFRAEFGERQAAFVSCRQQSDGGFAGRAGGSDLYYTDFAVRVLALVAPQGEALRRVARYCQGIPSKPKDIVECFCVLNIARTLRRCGGSAPLDTRGLGAALGKMALPEGGFPRHGDRRVSAYGTFLAALCCQMLGRAFPARDEAAARITALRCPDGGYGDLPGEKAGQTSATAAAIGFLTLCDALPEDVAPTAGFLARRQAPDGGLRAHADAPASDLLSTFTGLMTLAGLDAVDVLDVAALGRFVRAATIPRGGFGAGAGDPEPDVEYTYYGIGTLALLRAYLLSREE